MSDVSGVISYRGIEYAQGPGFRPLELDLYLPDGLTGPVPVVVHVHGGGWRRGSRRHPLPALGDGFYHELAATGIAIAAIDYRLSGEARYPAAVDDVRAAVTWARTALPGYGITLARWHCGVTRRAGTSRCSPRSPLPRSTGWSPGSRSPT